MTPKLPVVVLLLSISSSLLHPTTSLCVPRATSHLLHHVPQVTIVSSRKSAATPPPSPPPAATVPPPPTGPVDPAAKAICDRTDYPALCLRSAQFHRPGHIDPRSMLKLQCETLQYKTESIHDLATMLAGDPKTDKASAATYNEAARSLGDALDNLADAMQALEASDSGTMSSLLDALPTNYDDANNEFMDWEEPPPFLNDLDEFGHWSSNLLAIRDMVK